MDYYLDDCWNIYMHYKDLGECYNDNLELLMKIDTIQMFWRTINNIPKTYDIFSDGYGIKKIKRNNATPCAYSFFRDGISPCWEDIKNSSGFELTFKSGKKFEKFEKTWVNSMVELISNKKEIYKHINGIRAVDLTKMDSVLYRMEFWVDSEEIKEEIEKILVEDFHIDSRLCYRSHNNAKEFK